MKRMIWGILTLIVATTAAAAEPVVTSILLRVHCRGADASGRTFEWTELAYGGDVDGVVTLWKSPAGERFIFRMSEVYARSLTTFSIASVNTKEFLYGSFPLPYGGKTPAEAKANREKLPPDAYVGVPFTLSTRGYHATAPIAQWHVPDGQSVRAELRRHLTADFIRGMRENLIVASSFGSPGARAACDFLLDAAADGAVCRHDAKLKIDRAGEDCAFDAEFGYPCAQP